MQAMSNIWPIILVHGRSRALSICRLSHHSQSPPHDSSQTPPCAPPQTHLARYMNAERGRFRGAFHCASSTFKAEGAAAFYKVFFISVQNMERIKICFTFRVSTPPASASCPGTSASGFPLSKSRRPPMHIMQSDSTVQVERNHSV